MSLMRISSVDICQEAEKIRGRIGIDRWLDLKGRQDIEFFDFDDFLYDFDPKKMGLKTDLGRVVVAVLAPPIKSLYGKEVFYCRRFDTESYAQFIESSLSSCIADKVALIAEEIVWYSPNFDWAAYGSREKEQVALYKGSNGSMFTS